MNDLADIHDDFSDEVAERKDKLIKHMLRKGSGNPVYTKVFSTTKHLDDFLEKIKQKVNECKIRGLKVCGFDEDDDWVEFKDSKGNIHTSNALYFQYFDLYRIIDQHILRFTYFEIYYDDHIIGVLMRKSKFNSGDQIFNEFDLDRREWAEAKIQMQMWKQLYRLEVEKIDEISPKQKELLKYADETKIEKSIREKNLQILFQNSKLWVFIAYLVRMQLIPLLQFMRYPSYILNLKFVEDISESDISRKLRRYISCLGMTNRTLNERQIRVLDSFKEKAVTTNIPAHEIIMVQYKKDEAYAYFCDQLNDLIYNQRNNYSTEYPLSQIPILLGQKWIIDSTVINLELSMKDILGELYRTENLQNITLQFKRSLWKLIAESIEKFQQDYYLNGSEILRSGIQQLGSNIRKAEEAWKKWRNTQQFQYVPVEYFDMALYLGLMLNGKYNKNDFQESEGKDTTNAIVHLKTQLIDIERELSRAWNSFESFLRDMSRNKDCYNTNKPENKEEFNRLEQPFLMYRNDVGDLIVFPIALFERTVKKQFENCDSHQFIDLAYKKGLLFANSAAGDGAQKSLSIKVGKDTVRVYAFIVSSLPG